MAVNPTRTITVNGEGEAHGVPDRAELSAGVSSLVPTANAALADNARKMTAVFDALKRVGIADCAIQTSNFSVQPQYADTTCRSGAPRIPGYRVSNEVDVTLDDTKTLDGVLDTLVALGANQTSSVGFDISDPAALQTRTREVAMADSLSRAQTYARAGGVSWGRSFRSRRRAPPPMLRATTITRLMAPTPTAAGDVTVVLELK
jgi:hypothetical protein